VAEVTVCHSVPTVDEEIWRRTEPGTPPPRQRLRALARLRERGIRAGVLMAPLLPGLSARPEALEATVRAAAEHGAAFVAALPRRRGRGVREPYLGCIEGASPDLAGEYARLYPGKSPPRWYAAEVDRRVGTLKERHRLDQRHAPRPDGPRTPVQLSLGL